MGSRLAVAATLLAAAGCGEETTEPAPGGEETLVSYSRSGGIAGTLELLEVEADGAATLTTGYGSGARERSFEVPEGQLDRLAAAVAAVELEEVEPAGGTCADCFTYGIEIGAEEAEFQSTDLENDEDGPQLPAEALEPNRILSAIVVARIPGIID